MKMNLLQSLRGLSNVTWIHIYYSSRIVISSLYRKKAALLIKTCSFLMHLSAILYIVTKPINTGTEGFTTAPVYSVCKALQATAVREAGIE